MNMNLSKEIGGYLALDVKTSIPNNDNVVYLNTARNCLRYVIKAFNIKEIYIPYYTCPVVWQSIKKENCKIYFYHIDKKFNPICEFPSKAYILYTNYFGICAKNVKSLAEKYSNLIIDNAQAFYMPKYGIASFNSLRKFFGVSDGAFLFSDKKNNVQYEKDTSYQRFSHLLKRIDISAEFGYDDFCKNEEALNGEEIKIMSNLTYYIINSTDTESAKKRRIENFKILNSFLQDKNMLSLTLDIDDVPMVYPYLIKDENLKKKLIKNKIYVATYWNPLPEEYVEGTFQKYLIPLPLDQRYSIKDMERIIDLINIHE